MLLQPGFGRGVREIEMQPDEAAVIPRAGLGEPGGGFGRADRPAGAFRFEAVAADEAGLVCAVVRRVQNRCVKSQYSEPDSRIAAGRVSTQAISRLRMVDICRPERFAAIVPATPDESTCVVETGRP